MKLRFILALTFVTILFSGCGGPYLYTGLSVDKANLNPLMMIANDDIVCGNHIFKKDAKFSVSDASGGKYISHLYSEKQTFPDNTLFISTQEGSGLGVMVYPNGKFVYEGGGIAIIRAFNPGKTSGESSSVLLWSIDADIVCKFSGDSPFTPKKTNK